MFTAIIVGFLVIGLLEIFAPLVNFVVTVAVMLVGGIVAGVWLVLAGTIQPLFKMMISPVSGLRRKAYFR
jgi:hypothetical protein